MPAIPGKPLMLQSGLYPTWLIVFLNLINEIISKLYD